MFFGELSVTKIKFEWYNEHIIHSLLEWLGLNSEGIDFKYTFRHDNAPVHKASPVNHYTEENNVNLSLS